MGVAQHWLEAWPDADWGAATAAIEQVLSHLERNINPTLALTNMILDVREAINPPTGGSAVGNGLYASASGDPA